MLAEEGNGGTENRNPETKTTVAAKGGERKRAEKRKKGGGRDMANMSELGSSTVTGGMGRRGRCVWAEVDGIGSTF